MESTILTILITSVSSVAGIWIYRYRKILKNIDRPWLKETITLHDLIKESYPNVKEEDFSVSKLYDQYNIEVEDLQNKLSKDTNSLISNIADPGLRSAEMLLSIMKVPTAIYDTLSQGAEEKINNIIDLKQALIEQGIDNNSDGLIDSSGAVHRLAGHVAEYLHAEILNEEGAHNIIFATESNNPGFDFTIDGAQINPKNVEDFHSLAEHFDNYPDIPVLLPSDTLDIPDNALHIIPNDGVDQLLQWDGQSALINEGLVHDSAYETIQDSFDAANQYESAQGLDIPTVTLLLSSIREVKLLAESHTDFITSAKNIGLDVVGTGAGMFVGSNIGGALGTAILPGLGTIAGQFAGGFFGAIIGRLFSDEKKKENLNKAKKEYDDYLEKYHMKAKELEQKYQQILHEYIESKQQELRSLLERERDEIVEYIDKVKNEYESEIVLTDEEIEDNVELFESFLKKKINNIDSQLKKISIKDKYLWPSELTIGKRAMRSFYRSKLKNFKKQINAILNERNLTPVEKTPLIFEVFLATVNESYDFISGKLDLIEKESIKREKKIKLKLLLTLQKAVRLRQKTFSAIQAKVDEIKASLNNEIIGDVENVKLKLDVLKIEAYKLDKKL